MWSIEYSRVKCSHHGLEQMSRRLVRSWNDLDDGGACPEPYLHVIFPVIVIYFMFSIAEWMIGVGVTVAVVPIIAVAIVCLLIFIRIKLKSRHFTR